MSQVERQSECCRDEPFILPDICEMTCNLAELSAEMGEMSFYQQRWTSRVVMQYRTIIYSPHLCSGVV